MADITEILVESVEFSRLSNKSVAKHAAIGVLGVIAGEGYSVALFADGLRNIGDAAHL